MFRRRLIRTTAAVVAVLVSGLLAPAASWALPRGIHLTLVDARSTPRPATSLADLVLDDSGSRAYAVDTEGGRIEVFDVAGDAVMHRSTVTVGAAPVAISLDRASQKLYVADRVDSSIRVIDTNPLSPTSETVVTSIPVGSPSFAVTVDESAREMHVTGPNFALTTVDLDSGTVTSVPIGIGANHLAVDPVTHTVFAAGFSSNLLVEVKPGSSPVTHTMSGEVSLVDWVDTHLYLGLHEVASNDNYLQRFDSDLTLRATSPSMGSAPSGIAIDRSDDVILVAVGSRRINFLRASGLEDEGSNTATPVVAGIAMAADSERLLTRGGSTLSMFDITVDPPIGVSRLGGSDRYAASAAISADAFATGVGVAYIASGETFPDALAASAAAGLRRAPLLLTPRDDVPASIRAELGRLKPRSIVVIGGERTVSPAVIRELGDYTTGAVERIDGPDRFSVSAAVSARTFASGVTVAYVASGRGYADALSASAAAGAAKGPVLLVDTNSVPEAVRKELARLKPASLVIVGGRNSVSEATAKDLGTVATVTRIAGADRFESASAISKLAFPAGSASVYVASGENFPDALSGSAAAIRRGAPILLVGKNVIPPSVRDELTRLKPLHIAVLGGTETVSDAVKSQLGAYIAR
ncbi:hypothetical protein GCM10009851_08330 [Herbiconiux moechotypicola]|uniref:Cell wall-binding repeat-containing protein n=2 Tax=Herbiconiux moechotypicola TaxID=637393 RepID=A0ABN3DBJ6_9MICO